MSEWTAERQRAHLDQLRVANTGKKDSEETRELKRRAQRRAQRRRQARTKRGTS